MKITKKKKPHKIIREHYVNKIKQEIPEWEATRLYI